MVRIVHGTNSLGGYEQSKVRIVREPVVTFFISMYAFNVTVIAKMVHKPLKSDCIGLLVYFANLC